MSRLSAPSLRDAFEERFKENSRITVASLDKIIKTLEYQDQCSLQIILNVFRLDIEREEKRLWAEVEDPIPHLKNTKSSINLAPLYDLMSGEICGFEERVSERSISELPDGFFTCAPGLARGIHFDIPGEDSNVQGKGIVSTSKAITKLEPSHYEMEKLNLSHLDHDQDHGQEQEQGRNPIDELLPKEPLLLNVSKQSKAKLTEATSWAKSVDSNHIPPDYESVVHEMAFKFSFELDTFQKQAIYHLERGESVFVSAHTSAGKTVVAEYAIALSMKHLTKSIYTSPIKALSNQKFRDFKNTFKDVGLLTGDVQLNPDAACLIMTTEILRSMLYKGAELISDVEFVIFDEVHYVNDQERGVVWEEVIIMLPPHVTIIMLSATIPNTLEFADWVGRTKKKNIFVISTLKRPVPLEHHLYLEREFVKIVDKNKLFLESGYKEALKLQRGGGGVGGDDQKKKSSQLPNMVAGAVAPRNSQGGIYRGIKQERNLWIDVIYLLRKRSLLPVVIFTFSKRKCEENSDGLANTDLNSASEKSAVHIFLESSILKLKPEDRHLPQISRMKEMLSRGIAVHHSGLLPIMKEAVEILFSRGLVKVLFATETFAMGVNMPARTVVFSSIRKHDGNGFRNLLPGEYTQMAGRAGRRGLDTTGTVIIACPEEVPSESTLRTMILGLPTKLTSQFRLTYTMILNLLRVEALRVEEMMKKSFSENAGQKELPMEEQKILESEALLAKAEQLTCKTCEIDISQYYSSVVSILEYGRVLHEKILLDGKLNSRLLEPGRIIVVNNEILQNIPVVVLKILPASGGTTTMNISCIAIFNKVEDKNMEYLPLPLTLIKRLNFKSPITRETFQLTAKDIVMITTAKIKVPSDLGNTTIYRSGDLDDVQDEFLKWSSEHSNVLAEIEIPHFKSIDVEEKKLNRQVLIDNLGKFICPKCPDFIEHFRIFHKRRLLTEQLAELQFRISDSSLILLPEYHSRIALLKTLGYLDQASNVQLKGRVACELNTVDELITTELLFDNAFANSEPSEIVAILSSMVFQEKQKSEDPQFTGSLLEGINNLKNVAQRLSILSIEHGLEGGLHERLNLGLVEVVHNWAKGTPFTELTNLTDVLEGSIVRCIVRLDETCREIRGAARIMGDPILFKKMEEASQMIKRDICFASSLYI